MGVFDRILNMLAMMFGSTDYSKIVPTSGTVTGKITIFEAREAGTIISTLTDKTGTDVLASCLGGENMILGEWISNPKGFSVITVGGTGSIKVSGSTLVIT